MLPAQKELAASFWDKMTRFSLLHPEGKNETIICEETMKKQNPEINA